LSGADSPTIGLTLGDMKMCVYTTELGHAAVADEDLFVEEKWTKGLWQ
jgi:hypothetical protein